MVGPAGEEEVGPAREEEVVLERLVEEETMGFEETVAGELLPVEELPDMELMAAFKVVVTVSVTVAVGAGQLAVAVDEDEVGEVEDEILELEDDGFDRELEVELELEDEVLELENEGVNEVEELELELEKVVTEELKGTELEGLDDEDDVTEIAVLEAVEETMPVLEVAVVRVLELTTIEYTTAISYPPALLYPPHTSDGLPVHASVGPLDVVAPLSRAEPHKHWSPAWYDI